MHFFRIAQDIWSLSRRLTTLIHVLRSVLDQRFLLAFQSLWIIPFKGPTKIININ